MIWFWSFVGPSLVQKNLVIKEIFLSKKLSSFEEMERYSSRKTVRKVNFPVFSSYRTEGHRWLKCKVRGYLSMGHMYQLESRGQHFHLFCREQCVTLWHTINSVWIDVRKKIMRRSYKNGSFWWLHLFFWIWDNTIIWVKSWNSELTCFVTSTRASKCQKVAKLVRWRAKDGETRDLSEVCLILM